MGFGYDPDKDVPDLSGKVILITGGKLLSHLVSLNENLILMKTNADERLLIGTSGIGKTAILELAKHNPAHIYFTGRNEKAAAEVVSQCAVSSNITFLPCELDSFKSIRDAAAKFRHDRLDVFVANAGILAVPPAVTKDGYEIQFGVNHVGNAALLLRLLPIMLRTAREVQGADVRFVAVSSNGYMTHPMNGIDFDTLRSTQENLLFGKWARYGQSKLANVLLARELGKRYPQITSLAIHPGVVRTEMVTGLGVLDRMLIFAMSPLGLMTPREGAFNTLWAATSPDVKGRVDAETALFEPVGKPHGGDGKCRSDELSKKLWEWTVKEVGVEAE
ncbi:oxidoreductase, short-chain dehydrogenase reductase family [Trichoderma arundinaceum]|uniref:Oxidoreductase, short-chain dehydrogenase reductase family n=1 Tax=Trichoderma arundinaceum TaxID=490622 RepID=A0A395NCW3_TRIAR|nr:oxidoreductase, short-chain dehydrogenase reductase family [Trichoderma arundinaceum]